MYVADGVIRDHLVGFWELIVCSWAFIQSSLLRLWVYMGVHYWVLSMLGIGAEELCGLSWILFQWAAISWVLLIDLHGLFFTNRSIVSRCFPKWHYFVLTYLRRKMLWRRKNCLIWVFSTLLSKLEIWLLLTFFSLCSRTWLVCLTIDFGISDVFCFIFWVVPFIRHPLSLCFVFLSWVVRILVMLYLLCFNKIFILAIG